MRLSSISNMRAPAKTRKPGITILESSCSSWEFHGHSRGESVAGNVCLPSSSGSKWGPWIRLIHDDGTEYFIGSSRRGHAEIRCHFSHMTHICFMRQTDCSAHTADYSTPGNHFPCANTWLHKHCSCGLSTDGPYHAPQFDACNNSEVLHTTHLSSFSTLNQFRENRKTRYALVRSFQHTNRPQFRR